MRILVVGAGGREHALAWRCKQDLPHADIHCAPGNAGMAQLGTVHPVAVDDAGAVLRLALQTRPDLVVIGPEAALAAGVVDVLRDHHFEVFGPMMEPAQIESSKAYAKELMLECGLSTAKHWKVTTLAEAKAAVDGGARVVKADGLASGKGVTVCATPEETLLAVEKTLAAFGPPLVLEERLEGREVSVLALCDGERPLMLPTVQDHKRLKDHDEGPNTGGMGTISPGTHHLRLNMSEDVLLHRVEEEVMRPILDGMRARGAPFVGTLFAGLMVNPANGDVKVLEFNARFGDPETQVLMRRLVGNLPHALLACARGDAAHIKLGVSEEIAVCVVLASQGYPGEVRKGDKVLGLEEASRVDGVQLFQAGTKLVDGAPTTEGGRIINVTATGQTVAHAVDRAYHAASLIRWPGLQYRRDIGRAV